MSGVNPYQHLMGKGKDWKEPEAHPVETNTERRKVYTQKYGWVTHKQMLDHIRTKRVAREIHTSGFLSLSNFEVSYECCHCGFEGIFKAEKCVRCGGEIPR
jgi:hypothetical protein